MWLKLGFLLLYLLALFVISRLLQFLPLVYDFGLLSTAVLHPLSLSVRELKRILDTRGVNYAGVIEKQELTTLVETSGQLMESELDEAMNEEESLSTVIRDPNPSTEFTCGNHFYEEVEDSKDSVWLVQIVPSKSEKPLLDDLHWRRVVAHVKPFGIRTGIFNCNRDKRLCNKRSWRTPQIVLALPKGTHPKDNVVFHSFNYSAKSDVAIGWVRMQLASRLQVVSSVEELEGSWLNFTVGSSFDPKIRVLLMTTTNDVPLSFSALSMKFAGRVVFGVVSNRILLESNFLSTYATLPSAYVVITPEGSKLYGGRAGEHPNYSRLELYFRTLQPEMNDVFYLSLVVTNLLVFLDLIVVRRKLWRHVMDFFWTLTKYNFILFVFWITVFGFCHFSLVQTMSDYFLKVSRSLARCDSVGLLRHHYSFWRSCPRAFCLTFAILWAVYGYIRRNYFVDLSIDESSQTIFSSFLFRQRNLADGDIEEGLELLIQRLATPNLWLQPLIPNDYINYLPTWKYDGEWRSFNEDKVSSGAEGEDGGSDLGVVKSQIPQCSNVSMTDSSPETFCQSTFWLTNIVDSFLGSLRKIQRFFRKMNSASKPRRRKSGSEHRSGPPIGAKVATKCAICLDDYQLDIVLCGLPCGHNYHYRCIVDWLSRDHHNCPICRRSSFVSRGFHGHDD